jgi:hypothetical protein
MDRRQLLLFSGAALATACTSTHPTADGTKFNKLKL